jgi:hypothetical protein
MKPSIFSDIENDIQTKLKKKEIVYVEPLLPENPIIRLSNNDESYNNGMGCTLYASDSSLSHNTGLGIFTMKAIKAGDVAIPPTQKIKYQNIQVSPYLMMMKQHASLDNVIGGLDGTNIVATRDIEAGEEIFFKLQDYHNDFQSVYQVLHPNDPTMKTFEKVDVLTQQMLDSIPMRTVEVKPKKRYKQKKKRKTITKPVLDATMIFELFKDTIEGYDKTLASLLPKTHSEAQSLIDSGGKALYLSNKRSTSWLSKNSVCIDALNSNSNESKDGAFASRKISQGEVIISSPLIVMKKDDSFKHCLASSSESMLCPLTILSYNINDGVSASQCKSDDTNECPSNVVNARVDASSLNHSNSNMETIMTRIDNAKVRLSLCFICCSFNCSHLIVLSFSSGYCNKLYGRYYCNS